MKNENDLRARKREEEGNDAAQRQALSKKKNSNKNNQRQKIKYNAEATRLTRGEKRREFARLQAPSPLIFFSVSFLPPSPSPSLPIAQRVHDQPLA